MKQTENIFDSLILHEFSSCQVTIVAVVFILCLSSDLREISVFECEVAVFG